MKDTQMIVSKNNNFYIPILQRTANKGVEIVFDAVSNRSYSIRSYISSLSENGKLVYFDNDDVSEEVLGKLIFCSEKTFERVFVYILI